jgi:mono/diheme cytochrome c family protein
LGTGHTPPNLSFSGFEFMADQGIEHTTSQNWLRVLSIFALVAAVAVTVLLAFAWRREIPAITPPPRASFEAPLIERGALLASAGNCIACHTVRGGLPFAGGLPLPTPFGKLYSTNITPDAQSGIGRWSLQAFVRSMRQGVDRRGSHLYPAFPYTHFTRVTDDDLGALYAYLMTRTPVSSPAPDNELTFPLGFRPLLAGWKMLFFEPGLYRSDPAHNAEWNRGAYLAQGLTHCSACHSPRNAFGAERKDQHLGGGVVEGWWAPALNGQSSSPVPWTLDQLTSYLRTGVAETHAIAGGPMQDVVRSLAQLPEQDVRAIAVYVQSTLGPATTEQQARANESLARAAQWSSQHWSAAAQLDSAGDDVIRLGATVYANSCAGCHSEAAAGFLEQCLAPAAGGGAVRADPGQPDSHRARWHHAARRRGRALDAQLCWRA